MTSTTISEYTDVPEAFVWAGCVELSRHDGPTDGIVEYQGNDGYCGIAAPVGTDGAQRIKKQWAWSSVSHDNVPDRYRKATEAWLKAVEADTFDDSSEANR